MRRNITIRSIGAAAVCIWAIQCGSRAGSSGTEMETRVEEGDMQAETAALLSAYLEEFAALEKTMTSAYWRAANSGTPEDFEAFSKADLALKTFHSDKARYAELVRLNAHRDALDPVTARSLEVAILAFKGNQLPSELLADMVDRQSEIEQRFNAFRAALDGEEKNNNDLLEALKAEADSSKRKAIWEALKQVGAEVAPRLVELAEVRNRAAAALGYSDFWEMQIRLQEHDPDELVSIFEQLAALTDEPYREMKAELDGEIAAKFGISSDAVSAWHYDNPFFQAAPPSAAVDLDDFYESMPKEAIMEIAVRFFSDIGIPCDSVVARSDLYEREGKDQHAFCISIDRGRDVRTLLNIRPTAEWMDTALHEEGHGVFYLHIDSALPFNLREANHIFVTEAVAMLFGALGKNPAWMVAYAGADPEKVAEVEGAVLEQRRREQLVFARWALVMFHFERALYADPTQDLNTLWWDLVERFQRIPRPKGRNAPDWAAKPHFTIAPVYYHNYLLGEVFAAQLRHAFAKMSGHEGSTASLSFNGKKEFGRFLVERVFAPGMREPWPKFVENAMGEPFTAKYFAAETTR